MNPQLLSDGIDWLHVAECLRENARLHRPVRRRVPAFVRRRVGRQIRRGQCDVRLLGAIWR